MSEEMKTVVVLALLVAGFLLLPCKYDPAIRWKERNERRGKDSQ